MQQETFNPSDLESTYFFDSDHPLIQDFTYKTIGEAHTTLEKVLALYYTIRDGWRYNPSKVHRNPIYMKASYIVQQKEGHCIDKATLMVAGCRVIGVPARIGFAKVQNHIGTEKLEEKLKTNVLVPHGYVDVFLDGKWVKATPAFNKGLCDKLEVIPLDFNGQEDSIFQQYDTKGGQFMEYLEDYGGFSDLPLLFMFQLMKKEYPHLYPEKEEDIAKGIADFFELVNS